jgi:hypothetical protein
MDTIVPLAVPALLPQQTQTPLLRPLFAGNDPTFVVSDPAVSAHLRGRRLCTMEMHDAIADPPQDVVLVFDRDDVASLPLAQLRQSFAHSRVLLVGCAAFDASAEAVIYTLDLLVQSDFAKSHERGLAHKQRLEAASGPLVFRNPASPGMSLVCETPEGIRVHAPAELGITPGRWREVPDFFEVSLHLPVVVSGELPVMGMLAARHARMPAEVVPRHHEGITMVREYGLHHSGAVLYSKAGRPSGFSPAPGAEAPPPIIHTIRRLSRAELRPAYVEVAVGTNTLGNGVRWEVNSCINEGVDGLHIAVGDAVTGVHLDFISPGTVLQC